jgi:hypothetical protein
MAGFGSCEVGGLRRCTGVRTLRVLTKETTPRGTCEAPLAAPVHYPRTSPARPPRRPAPARIQYHVPRLEQRRRPPPSRLQNSPCVRSLPPACVRARLRTQQLHTRRTNTPTAGPTGQNLYPPPNITDTPSAPTKSSNVTPEPWEGPRACFTTGRHASRHPAPDSVRIR